MIYFILNYVLCRQSLIFLAKNMTFAVDLKTALRMSSPCFVFFQMQDIVEQEENKRYNFHGRRGDQSSHSGSRQQPFVVRNAPWHQSVRCASLL